MCVHVLFVSLTARLYMRVFVVPVPVYVGEVLAARGRAAAGVGP